MVADSLFAAAGAPIAQTRSGRVRGFMRRSVAVFLGIPYGASTAGPNRFMPPQPPAPWTDVRDATKFGQRSPQPFPPTYTDQTIGAYMAGGRQQELIALAEPTGEDCLKLNVLTPATDRKRRPVLFYIHGGGFAAGSGSTMSVCDGLVAEQDVVLVTVNHRLNALGFLYLGGISQKYAQGNPGMLDLVAALRWVRENIANFGGDPSRVTIFGESGGGAKVALLVAMPHAKGLFHGAIIESGGVPEPKAPDKATAETQAFLTKNNISAGDIDKLQNLPIESFYGMEMLTQSPVADGKTLVAAPWKNGTPATAAGIPMLMGYCADEATLLSSDKSVYALDWNVLPAKLSERIGKPVDALGPIIEAYRKVKPAEDASGIYFRIVSDGMFGKGMLELANKKSKQAPPVYFYRMEYDTQLPPGLRAFHTSELALVGRMVLQPKAELLSRQLAGAWAAFARTGNPNHAILPKWERYSEAGRQIMMFDLSTRSGIDPQAEPRAALQQLLGSGKIDIIVPKG